LLGYIYQGPLNVGYNYDKPYIKKWDMAKGRKKSSNDIEAYRHEKETRKNAVPVGLASYDTAKPKKYEDGII